MILFFFFLFSLVIDQVSKKYFINLFETNQLWPFTFSLVSNEGFFLGSFSHLPLTLRAISISALYGVVLLIYFSIQYFLINEIYLLRIGTTLLLGGITGNTVDRILHGSVKDFISIIPGLYFNLADLIQLIGSLLVVYSMFRYRDQIWHPDCLRKSYLVNFKFQFQFSLMFGFLAFVISVIFGLFTFLFVNNVNFNPTYLKPFFICFLSLAFMSISISILVGFFFSHRYIGPLYAFELFIEDLLAGKKREFRLRAKDRNKHLEEIGLKVLKVFKDNQQ